MTIRVLANRLIFKVVSAVVFVILTSVCLDARSVKDTFTDNVEGAIPITGTEMLEFRRDQLPRTPRDTADANLGLAGVFAGYIGDNLIIAGGANFPDGIAPDGGSKHWWADLYIQSPDGRWKYYPDFLPQKTAYGCAFEYGGGLLCIGGCQEGKCNDDVYLITLDGSGSPIITSWAPLPEPMSNMTGALIGNKVYLSGGIRSMKDNESTNVFISLDLSNIRSGWKYLDPFPGTDRAFAVSAVQSDGLDNCYYVFAGRKIKGDEILEVLTDGWKYNPRLSEWSKVDGEFPVMARSCTTLGTNHILFLANPMILYHTVTASSVVIDPGFKMPVTTAVASKGLEFCICSGEVSPWIRTPEIIKGAVVSDVKTLGILDITVILLYFLILAGMGIYFSRRQKNTDDYFKGGGRIPWFIVGLSIFGTALSAITFMAIPAKAYATDWSYMFFNMGIVLVVPLIVLLFIPFYRNMGVTTAYEYLEKRFNPAVRVICSLSFIVYQIGRMGVVLLLPAIALNVVTGFNIFLCVSLMGAFALVYTYMGGIEAVAWTDAVQVVVLLGSAIAVVLSVAGSLPHGIGDIIAIGSADMKYDLGSLKFDLRQATIWTTLIATVFTNITTYGTDQTIVQRYLTTSTEKQARKSVYTNAILSIPATLLFFFVGTAIYVFFKTHPYDLSASVNNPDAILPWYVSLKMPSGVVGLVIAGIFAAAMSTLSASMNSAATAYITDIYSKIPSSAHRDEFRAAKRATIIIGVIGVAFALMMATWDVKSLWDEFSKILGILLGGLGGLFLLAFLCRQANSAGAICGLAGCITVQMIVMHYQAVNLLLYSTVGFVSCFVIGWVVSLLTGGPRKDVSEFCVGHKK